MCNQIVRLWAHTTLLWWSRKHPDLFINPGLDWGLVTNDDFHLKTDTKHTVGKHPSKGFVSAVDNTFHSYNVLTIKFTEYIRTSFSDGNPSVSLTHFYHSQLNMQVKSTDLLWFSHGRCSLFYSLVKALWTFQGVEGLKRNVPVWRKACQQQ